MRWNRAHLSDLGFTGWVPVTALDRADVPTGAGAYVVVRPTTEPPQFLAVSEAGRPERDPSVDPELLAAAWVDGVELLYVGKASAGVGKRRGLAKRLDELRRFGLGVGSHHWGGRHVWQLADHRDLLVGWLETPERDPAEVEAALVADFEAEHGRLPFANLRRGPRPGLPSIRPATADDVSAVVALWGVAAENSSRPVDRPDLVQRLLRQDPEALLVAEFEGQVVGTVIGGWDGWRASLYRLAVSPEYRRRGIATVLVAAAEDRLRTLGAERIQAMILEENSDGHGLWSSLGYTPQTDWRRWVKSTR